MPVEAQTSHKGTLVLAYPCQFQPLPISTINIISRVKDLETYTR